MSLNELSRAVAMKALAADVAARLENGERPGAIRAQLLAEGYPPEVVEHVFAECEFARPVPGRKRTVFAAVLSAALLLGLPLAGGFAGAWAAGSLALRHKPDDAAPKLNAQEAEIAATAEKELRGEGDANLADSLYAIVFGFVGFLLGSGLGLAAAFPAVRALSEWSIDSSITDDAPY
jgi:hypothetical protein